MADSSAMSEDVLMEILVKLPVKSLARFQCVCKSWRRLIAGDYVRSRLPMSTAGVFFIDNPGGDRRDGYAVPVDGCLKAVDLGFFPFSHTAAIIDGSNGLLLYYTSSSSSFYVVEPAAGRWTAIPSPRKKTLLTVLAFDPCTSPEYYVVCFTAWRVRGAVIELFSSSDAGGQWRAHDVNFGNIDTDTMSTKMHCFDGVLYILSFSGHIACIDLTNMSTVTVPLPAQMSSRACAGHSSGRLMYCRSDRDGVKIWALERAKNSCQWALEHVVDAGEMGVGVPGGEPWHAEVMALHPVREVVYLWTQWRLVSYDLKEKRVDRQWRFEEEEDDEKAYLVQFSAFPKSS